ncbi:MAG: YdcF family protein [Spartobacteria bacterium]|nr:YdcF family protein [Spartobacteria bacterium]
MRFRFLLCRSRCAEHRSHVTARSFKFAIVFAVGVILLGAVIVYGGVRWFDPFWREVLIVQTAVEPADAIVVLGGESQGRPVEAARLYNEGLAPRVFVVGTGDNERNRRALLRAGVPEDRITCETASESTLENAMFVRPLLEKAGVHRAILVTSSYHTRRALAVFQQRVPGIHFDMASSRIGWWDTPKGRRQENAWAVIEFIKIPAYWILYGVHPWIEKSPAVGTLAPVT